LETLSNIIISSAQWLEGSTKKSSRQRSETNEGSLEIPTNAEKFDKNIQMKSSLRQSVQKFNYKPSLGLRTLI